MLKERLAIVEVLLPKVLLPKVLLRRPPVFTPPRPLVTHEPWGLTHVCGRPTSTVSARLVYYNDHYIPSLSAPSPHCYNTATADLATLPPHILRQFARLPDAATDDFPYQDKSKRDPIPISALSGVDHAVGPYNSQSAVNTQAGTACFAALNTVKCRDVAVVDVPEGVSVELPVQVVRVYGEGGVGGAIHSRVVVSAGENSKATVLQVRRTRERTERGELLRRTIGRL